MTALGFPHQWESVEKILAAMQQDVHVGSHVDMEVGAYSVLSLMNEMRLEHHVRQQRLCSESINKLKVAAYEIANTAETLRTSTAVQTAAVALLKALLEVEVKQDDEQIDATQG